MEFAVIALSNNSGPWSELLKNGPEMTWLPTSSNLTFYSRYFSSRTNFMDNIINSIYNSRISAKLWHSKKLELSKIMIIRKNNSLIVLQNENWSNLVSKTLKAIEYALENSNFDYLIRINSTAYCDLKKISELLLKLDLPDYAGPLLNKKSFISGWAIILSRDACQLLVEARKQTCLFDDEFIGEFLKTRDIFPLAFPFLEINSFEELNNLKESDYLTFPLIRFKSIGDHNKRSDALIMQKFHQKRVTAS